MWETVYKILFILRTLKIEAWISQWNIHSIRAMTR